MVHFQPSKMKLVLTQNQPENLGTVCWIAGWGRMADGSLPNILQEVDIEMISDEICHTTKNTEMLTVSKTTPSDWLPVLDSITPSHWWRMSFRIRIGVNVKR